MKVAIISASVRDGRDSPRVALYFRNFIQENKLADVEILDLKEYNFPIFNERLKYQKDPKPKTLEFAEKVRNADGIIIVTPEYNGGYPASLKNVIDLLIGEWEGKPISISTVSSGGFGGMNMISSLQYSLWKLHALTVPWMFPVPKVADNYDETGIPKDKEGTDKRAHKFIEELIRTIENNTI